MTMRPARTRTTRQPDPGQPLIVERLTFGHGMHAPVPAAAAAALAHEPKPFRFSQPETWDWGWGGLLIFSNNFRKFRLDQEALAGARDGRRSATVLVSAQP